MLKQRLSTFWKSDERLLRMSRRHLFAIFLLFSCTSAWPASSEVDERNDVEVGWCDVDPVLYSATVKAFTKLAKFFNLEIEITNEVAAVAGNELVLEDCKLYRKARELAEQLCAGTTAECGKYDCVNQTRGYTDNLQKLAFYYAKVAYMLFENLERAYKTILVEAPKSRQLEEKPFLSAAAGCAHADCSGNVTIVCLLGSMTEYLERLEEDNNFVQ